MEIWVEVVWLESKGRTRLFMRQDGEDCHHILLKTLTKKLRLTNQLSHTYTNTPGHVWPNVILSVSALLFLSSFTLI